VILNASEYHLDGADKPATRIVKVRNPWAISEFTGAYSKDSAEYTKLLKYFEEKGIKHSDEGGKFFMEWSDLRSTSNSLDVCYGQESKLVDEDELPEWQPRL